MNLWTADHENGLTLPSWSTDPNPTKFVVKSRPAGGPVELGLYAMECTSAAGINDEELGPKIIFNPVLPNEIYGSFQIYIPSGRHIGNGGVLGTNSQNELLQGIRIPGLVNPGSQDYCFEVNLWTTNDPNTGTYNIAVRCGNVSGSGAAPILSASVGGLARDAWNQIDYHCKYNGPSSIVEIKLNCGAYSSQSGDLGSYGTPNQIQLHAGGGTMTYGWVDNFVINDTSGTFHNNDVCTSGFPGQTFTGQDGASISPAPEKLPHVITIEDVGGNRSLQRKLQENFDVIERQLLALDPDNQGNKDPLR